MSGIASLQLSPREEEIRSMLDEAVLFHQACRREGLAIEEPQQLILDIAQVLHSPISGSRYHQERIQITESATTSNDRVSLLVDASEKLDQAIIEAVDKPDLSRTTVEALAAQFHQLVTTTKPGPSLQQQSIATKPSKNTLAEDILLGEIQVRLAKLRQVLPESPPSATEHAPAAPVHIAEAYENLFIDCFVGDDDENELYAVTDPKDESLDDEKEEEVDVAIVGAGIGGLCAGAILNTLYGQSPFAAFVTCPHCRPYTSPR
jgi:hypothetical protein